MTRFRAVGALLFFGVVSCGNEDGDTPTDVETDSETPTDAEIPIDSALGLDGRPQNDSCVGGGEFPERLSEHPCFVDEPPRVSEALVPYDVNAPLWSDGADKHRYLALPEGSALQVERNGNFELPAGGVIVKEFALSDRLLETRLLTRDEHGQWHAATYVWNEEQEEAVLTPEGAQLELDGGIWMVPNEDECFECHTEAAGVSLGLSQRQMSREQRYPSTGRRADQIDTLAGVGMLEGESDDEPLAVPSDEAAELEDRARAYLHANCSHCHRPGGLGEGEIDLRITTPLRLTETCNVPPMHGDLASDETDEGDEGDGGEAQPEGALIVAPGDASASTLYLRMVSSRSSTRMPPLGTVEVDETGSQLIEAWINSIEECPE